MSTAEIGKTLSPAIKAQKIHAICCTGANLEEDLFNLVARSDYEKITNWRELTPLMISISTIEGSIVSQMSQYQNIGQ